MSKLPVLDANEQRILGALMEKQTTVPATYPLSANALRTACNQTSSREPVLDLDLPTVEQTARDLKNRQLLRIVWADKGPRTLKYHQTLEERLALQGDERALLTVLLLRGGQTPGELHTRTDRLHGFADRGEVESCLAQMAARPEPLVRELDRQPGQRDRRWEHLLGAPVGERPFALRTARVLLVSPESCTVAGSQGEHRVGYAPTLPGPAAERISPGHLVAIATGPDGSDVVVWRWYDAVVLGRAADGVRLWEPAHGEVLARPRPSYAETLPGRRALASAGLPGAHWWVTGDESAVDLDEVQRLYDENDLWARAFGATAG